MREKAVQRGVTPAGQDHAVVSLSGGDGGHRNTPCGQCPWRVDATGVFPPEAFRVSAHTAYDQASAKFGCHDSNHEHPQTCAGFLLRGADNNLGVRMGLISGQTRQDRLDDGGLELYDSYVDMAVANGVDPDDPILQRCEPQQQERWLDEKRAARRKKTR